MIYGEVSEGGYNHDGYYMVLRRVNVCVCILENVLVLCLEISKFQSRDLFEMLGTAPFYKPFSPGPIVRSYLFCNPGKS